MSGEMEFTRRICTELENDGALIFPIVASKMQKPGWPDRLVVHRHAMFLLEFKGPTTPISLAQESVHTAISLRGPYVFLARAPGFLSIRALASYCHVGSFSTGAELAEVVRRHISTLKRE